MEREREEQERMHTLQPVRKKGEMYKAKQVWLETEKQKYQIICKLQSNRLL